ncbi:MAG: hypothetical protein ACJ72L_15870 [Marmoricola sp.]
MPLLRTSCVATATVALLLGTVLSGCGSASSDNDSRGGPKVKVLTEAEATSALMTEANLGDHFTGTPATPDSSAAPGCLQGVSDIVGDKDLAKNTAERDFTANDTATNIYLGHKVLSYSSVAAAKKAVADVRAVLVGCDKVTDTDSDGFTYDTTVTSDDAKTESTVDDQVNAVVDGTVTPNGASSSKITLYLTLVRVGNDIAALTGSVLDAQLPGPVSDVITVITDRLVAVAAGEKPDESVVAGS